MTLARFEQRSRRRNRRSGKPARRHGRRHQTPRHRNVLRDRRHLTPRPHAVDSSSKAIRRKQQGRLEGVRRRLHEILCSGSWFGCCLSLLATSGSHRLAERTQPDTTNGVLTTRAAPPAVLLSDYARSTRGDCQGGDGILEVDMFRIDSSRVLIVTRPLLFWAVASQRAHLASGHSAKRLRRGKTHCPCSAGAASVLVLHPRIGSARTHRRPPYLRET